jgi:uncharacterized protein YcaQ
MRIIDLNQVNYFCLGKQHLTEDAKIDDVVQIADDIAGLHATCPTTPYLSVFARSRDFSRADLDEELYIKRSLGKFRSARKTLYVLPKEMIPYAHAAMKTMLEDRFEKYIQYQGFTREEYENTAKSILELLQDNGMPTTDIKKALGTKANVSAIVNVMCDQGLLIRGEPKQGWKSNIHTYKLFQEYLPDVNLHQVDESTAKKELIKKYLIAFGPVTIHDISWWTGFTKTEVKKIMEELEHEITNIQIEPSGENHIMLSTEEELLQSTNPSDKPIVNLLPALDSYLMGYKKRDRYLKQEHADFMYDRSGNATSAILVNGRIVGIWDFSEDKEPVVKLFLFENVEKELMKIMSAKASEIGEFMADKECQIKRCDSMVPLSKRPYGSFMAPLKDCSCFNGV